MTVQTPFLICSFDIARDGNAIPVGADDLYRPPPAGHWRWIHIDRCSVGAREFLNQLDNVDAIAVEAMLESETRPRCTSLQNGTLIILRGVNLNPGADPHEMLAVRSWFGDNIVITVRRYRLMALNDIRANYEANRGPRTPGEFLADLSFGLSERMAPIIMAFEERLDELEESISKASTPELRARLVKVRQDVIPLRRYLSPQREALAQIMALRSDWIDEQQHVRLRENSERVTRYIEEIDSVRDRASLLHEEIANSLSERMNRNMYVLSIIAAIFLPLGLLTGLLGINVGGIPGSDSPWGFIIFSGILLVVAIFELWLFRRLRWL